MLPPVSALPPGRTFFGFWGEVVAIQGTAFLTGEGLRSGENVRGEVCPIQECGVCCRRMFVVLHSIIRAITHRKDRRYGERRLWCVCTQCLGKSDQHRYQRYAHVDDG